MGEYPGQDGCLAGKFPAGVAVTVADGAEGEAEGGEPACWAHLVCPECGAITSEGHRKECRLAPGTARNG